MFWVLNLFGFYAFPLLILGHFSCKQLKYTDLSCSIRLSKVDFSSLSTSLSACPCILLILLCYSLNFDCGIHILYIYIYNIYNIYILYIYIPFIYIYILYIYPTIYPTRANFLYEIEKPELKMNTIYIGKFRYTPMITS